MNQTASQNEDLFRRARSGDREALGALLEQHRSYLKVLTERELDQRLEARLDASDIVQQTCLSVFRKFAQFTGQSRGEFLAWLRQVHANNLRDAVRDQLLTQKRDPGRELPGAALAAISDEPSPSQRLLHDEQAVQLTRALDTLPKDQREAVRLRYLEGLSLADLSRRLGRSEDAAASLIKRGIRGLRKLLHDESRER